MKKSEAVRLKVLLTNLQEASQRRDSILGEITDFIDENVEIETEPSALKSAHEIAGGYVANFQSQEGSDCESLKKQPPEGMKKLNKGDRVIHEYLGAGTFIRYSMIVLRSNNGCLSVVKWDNNPPIIYNRGHNPSCVFTSELHPERKGE